MVPWKSLSIDKCNVLTPCITEAKVKFHFNIIWRYSFLCEQELTSEAERTVEEYEQKVRDVAEEIRAGTVDRVDRALHTVHELDESDSAQLQENALHQYK